MIKQRPFKYNNYISKGRDDFIYFFLGDELYKKDYLNNDLKYSNFNSYNNELY